MAENPEILTRRAPAASGNTVVVATMTPVPRRDSKGPFWEILDPAGAEWPDDLPLVDTHQTGSVRAMLGRAGNVRREGDEIVADLTFSTADDVAPIRQRWADGTAKHVSAGYTVSEWQESRENGQRVKRAARWRLVEISLVANPADPNARKRAMENELQDVLERQAQIDTIRAALGLPEEWGDDLPDDATEDQIRAAAREAMQRRSAPRIRVTRDHTDPAVIVRRQSDALAFRMGAAELPDDARQHVGLSFRDLAAESLARAGESTRGLTADEVFQRAAQHTTSDFALVVSNAANKVALAGYQAAESPLKVLARQRVLPNFKESTSIRAGELGRLEELTESGEITATSRAESGEVLRLGTFARRFDVSRKLLIDDDAGVLGDTVAALGQAAAQTEADLMVALMTGNPNLRDGTPVFDASRGNIGTAAALSVESLALARKALRIRKGLDGVTPISATPRFLLVGPDEETEAEKVLASIYATKTDDVNPLAGKLTLLVEPRITGSQWLIFADPARLASLQYAYLSSAQGVQIQRQEAWNTLGMSFRAFLDFGAGWLDWRGAQFNAGA